MYRPLSLATLLMLWSSTLLFPADINPPNAGRGVGTVPVWNPHHAAPGNRPLKKKLIEHDAAVLREGQDRWKHEATDKKKATKPPTRN